MRVLVKHHNICQATLKLTPCYIKAQQEQCGWKNFEKAQRLEQKMYRDFFIQYPLFYEKPLSCLPHFSNFI